MAACAVRARTIEFEAPARRAVGPSGAPFPDILRERLRVSKAPLAALGADAALTRAVRPLSLATNGAPASLPSPHSSVHAVGLPAAWRPFETRSMPSWLFM